jgi:hypothetical protein
MDIRKGGLIKNQVEGLRSVLALGTGRADLGVGSAEFAGSTRVATAQVADVGTWRGEEGEEGGVRKEGKEREEREERKEG